MKITLPLGSLALATAPFVYAHYRFKSLIIDGQETEDWKYVRESDNDYYPIEDVASMSMRCNSGGANGNHTETATVKAGDTVGFGLSQAIFHKGPLNVYMSKVDNAKTADGSSGWFKMYEIPPILDGGKSVIWPAVNLTKVTFPLPKTIESGDYLLRIEQIGLHLAIDKYAAQFFISCAQLRVTGGGSARPSTVMFPGVYKDTDPGLWINIYEPVPTNYTMPGPALFQDS
ncbi:SubName: Full=Related to cellulose binding protein CEL1 {ECO:0000313/EMBL:CCA73144.1} [Serendipita indica DSM 11827]|uniref:lytic cellulose monooxygenase (C4-dehydrogenating) n=1 Tax=Serendipita indica (strain DSM 11827) TaxID=1109443 RepID=G4TPA1_SERID|nr:SubName: Full=Related to cellulose binding protein CEL1 {ECO:0000313/EMBL:CCA73144.1} [Serendipita indica DSM 11827]CCA73144.1 related to cellulose binding protein CEL1 [Serendipita indica DSM 11827]